MSYQLAIQPSTLGTKIARVREVCAVSSALIAGLVLAGLFILITIGYINQLVEKGNLEKARQRAELNDRIRRCALLSDAFPGQMMTPALKLMLSRLELHLAERLLPLDKKNAALASRIEALRASVAQGQDIPVTNSPTKIMTEAQAKELRLLLDDLQALVVWAAKQRQLEPMQAKQWLAETQRMLVLLHVEYFTNAGKLALQQGNAHKARLAFERGLQYVRKQANQADYQTQRKQLEANYAHANQLEQTQQKPDLNEPSELTEGLKAFETEDDWKKNNIY